MKKQVVPAPQPIGTAPPAPARRCTAWHKAMADGAVRTGAGILLVLILAAVFAPWLGTIDPTAIDPGSANLLPLARGEFNSLAGDAPFDHLFLMGSDSLGRDIWSRCLYGARVSLAVGIVTALLSVSLGACVGVAAGYFRRIDGVIMRFMDGVMAIPGILFAISLVALFRGSLLTVIVAIAIPEIPRVARLVRSVVLSVREEAYVEAAIALDTPPLKVLVRHILPNAFAPLIVQATYIVASAILVEAILSFLGVGLPADIATWGNIMAEGRSHFNAYPHNILLPGVFLAATVLAVNILGDGLRDSLDPKFSKRA